ncbi:hypothetical protein ACQCVE_03040 [Metabacillus sp. 113a]|uniref:hypothetical protein n=1 Tax=Metabacillus sp. 113a TaxID=3404706 RepID=UPI003CF25211
MAFGIKREDLQQWKRAVARGEIAFLTHFWQDDRFPEAKSVTKAGCSDIRKLADWGKGFGLQEQWIDSRSDFPHFDLMGAKQAEVLMHYKMYKTMQKFKIYT